LEKGAEFHETAYFGDVVRHHFPGGIAAHQRAGLQ
jgi:hypothetical protein